ncbi:MAG: hypothetical protein DRP00_02830 [Candidatus Aenigmatarchaeota archaeon]|nr:MAG: hypothetical protein DRP00_02830 [Candidatus Aenigmarchaeota archaeon]
MSVPIQEFEKKDLEFAKKGMSVVEITSEPTKGLKILSMSPSKNVAVLKRLEYEKAYTAVKPTTSPAQQGITITASIFGFPLPKTKVSLFNLETGQKLGVVETDENGIAHYNINTNEPTSFSIVAGIGDTGRPPLFPMTNPLADIKPFTTWLIVVKATAISDRWARFIGRSIGEPLPYYFWKEKPRTVLGILGIRFTFADLVPVFGSQSLTYEIGISAYCNTVSPYPTYEECCDPKNAAWWDVKVYATNKKSEVGKVLKGETGYVGGDKINLDYHLKYTITTTGITFDGRYLVKKRCDWEV